MTFDTVSRELLRSSRFQSAKKELLAAIAEAADGMRAIREKPSSEEAKAAYLKAIQDFTQNRGRELYYPYVASGVGSGPYVELIDGSVKLDMITAIGVNFFGHAHPELISEMIDALPADVMQGNLQPGNEARFLLEAILARVGNGCRLRHGWLLCSGTMSNEIALKIIRQKKAPATKILAFRDCFAGRSTAMQEITDNPKYREGQPVYGEVEYLPFYDPKMGFEASMAETLGRMKEHLDRYPDKFCALMMELVQGEGGFNVAPREFYVRLFEEAHKRGLVVWVDEIQTFGRTGELFAYQKLGLNEYVDVVTIGKMLQACMVLYTAELNPKPGLVAGTFAGSTVALRAAKKVLELLDRDGFLGKEGRIEKLAFHFLSKMQGLTEGSCKGLIRDVRAFGGMLSFEVLGGTMDDVKAILFRLFDLGMIAFFCGHGPYRIRMLPPFGAMNEKDLDLVCELTEKAVLEVAAERNQRKA